MIRGEIQIVAETQQDMVLELESLAKTIRDSCRLDVPDGQHKIDAAFHGISVMATFTVLPEYQDRHD